MSNEPHSVGQIKLSAVADLVKISGRSSLNATKNKEVSTSRIGASITSDLQDPSSIIFDEVDNCIIDLALP